MSRATYTDENGFTLTAARYDSIEFGDGAIGCTVTSPEGEELFHSGGANLADFQEATLSTYLKGILSLLGYFSAEKTGSEQGGSFSEPVTFVRTGEPYEHHGQLLRWTCSGCGAMSWSFERRIYWPRYCCRCAAPINRFDQEGEQR